MLQAVLSALRNSTANDFGGPKNHRFVINSLFTRSRMVGFCQRWLRICERVKRFSRGNGKSEKTPNRGKGGNA